MSIEEEKESIAVRVSKFTARNPWKVYAGTLVVALVISTIGIVVGDFNIAVDNDGWRSRGTLISKRALQAQKIESNDEDLIEDPDGGLWEVLETTRTNMDWIWAGETTSVDGNSSDVGNVTERYLTAGSVRGLERENCDLNWYYSGNYNNNDNLIAAWKTSPELEDDESGILSVLHSSVLSQICKAEESTLAMLEDLNACAERCDNGKCLPPHSLTLVLKYFIGEDLNLSCDDLIEAYTQSVQSSFETSLVNCVDDIKESYDPVTEQFGNVTCPDFFDANLVSSSFGSDNALLRYTSSIFQTSGFNDIVFENLKDERLDRGDGVIVEGAYETNDDYFADTTVDNAVQLDMLLACGSLFITSIAMAVHTKSLWLTINGLIQIIFSIPLAYFFYYFVVGLKFFPFLNFIGVFVVAALGADDVFVAVDKWKNARIENPNGTTEEVAMKALPDAAGAMLLTTITTAAAFFATAICKVAPILCFAVFCGSLIVFDYAMNVFLVFPALCIYDRWLMNGKRNCCISFSRNSVSNASSESESSKEKEITTPESLEEHPVEAESKPSLIHRILSGYYSYLHKFRYFVLALCVAAMGICVYMSLQFKLPETTDVRLLPEGHEFELSFTWESKLLSNSLMNLGGTNVGLYWGLIGEDDGNWNDPTSLPTLSVDNEFDPTSTEAQKYLLNFCDKLLAQDFASLPRDDYVCPINSFDSWLKEQSSLAEGDQDEIYGMYCDGATSVPMDESAFTDCFYNFGSSGLYIDMSDRPILKQGNLQVMRMKVYTDVNWKSPISETSGRWKDFEKFLEQEREIAPTGVNQMFHSSSAFWWADTNLQMLNCAFGAAGIAIGFSTLIVLIASRSILMTIFSAIAILYVLGATTSSLVGLGWSLGFLESICFAILIGISCDFVIHFCHAYNHLKGSQSRNDRTKFAVIHMGPSILAAAATTFAAASIMFGCKVLFFTKFAMILFQTMLHSTLGSFVVFLCLTDIFGPREPTKAVDDLLGKCCGGKTTSSDEKSENE